ncbi:O-methyltransferase [Dentipellis sp. KUC8613]|nr:O-methyltransferase [Dentipellis sp. KUC8613]
MQRLEKPPNNRPVCPLQYQTSKIFIHHYFTPRDTMSNETNALAELKALVKLLQSNVDRIEAATKSASLEFPSLQTTFSSQSEAARQLPDVAEASSQIVAAASQLIATVRPPTMTVFSTGLSFHIPSALRVAVETHVAEVLREAGSGGAHVKEIAKPANVDPYKLARILRILATHYIFVEVAPDVFANNIISSCLDSGKSVAALIAHPEQRYDGTLGITALLGHFGDDAFKASAYLSDVLTDPATSHSYEANKTAHSRAFNINLDMFSWFETPGNEYRATRFGHAMNGSRASMPANAIVEGFDWKGLKEGAVVVDVGGGVGSQSLVLSKHFSHLRFIVQDRALVVLEGEKFWGINNPEYLSSGKVKLQPYNFLDEEQPVKNADVFIIRAILHDWADEYCIKILRKLRKVATPHTRLLVVDNIIAYACKEEATKDIPGAAMPLPPAPLLANWGPASSTSYLVDIQMLSCHNGQERTATQLRDLLGKAGWKLVEVRRATSFGLALHNAIAVPV